MRARLSELEVTEVQDKFAKAKRTSDLDIELKTGDVVEPVQAKRAVAVFPFDPARKEQRPLAMLMTERLTTELAAHGVPVVERELLDRVLVEQGLQTVPLFDADRAAKLGRLLGAQLVLTGSVDSIQSGTAEVHARLIKVSTGEVLVAGSEQMHVEVPKKETPQPTPPTPAPRGQTAAPAPTLSPQQKEDLALQAKFDTPVTLAKPYPPSYPGAPTDRVSLQFAVQEIARQAGLGFDAETSRKNADATVRKWVYPDFHGIRFADAMDVLLAPEGLMYNIVDGNVVLRTK